MSLSVTASPFAHDDSTVAKLMTHYFVALLPALFMAGLLFKGSALILTGICVISSMVWESIACLILKKKNTATDITAAVTGLLFAMTLPPAFPFYKAILGTLIAVGILKPIFTKIGIHPLNCALFGRLMMYFMFKADFVYIMPFSNASLQALNDIKDIPPLQGNWNGSYSTLFLGNVCGGIGEVSVLAAILGMVYLLALRVTDMYGAVAFIGSISMFSVICHQDPLFNILAGGTMLAAIFFVTDSQTTPLTPTGKLIFGILAGAFTCVIRFYTHFTQDWVTAILLADLFTPVIDRFIEKKSRFA